VRTQQHAPPLSVSMLRTMAQRVLLLLLLLLLLLVRLLWPL
jgi:hypothetical protein